MFKNCLRLEDLKLVSSTASHSAFTDLQRYNDWLFCCYRQASDHVSGNGRLEISQLSNDGLVQQRQHLQLPGRDLRDPKLSVHGGKLWLIALGKVVDRTLTNRPTMMVSWFSSNGQSWSSPHFFGTKWWWYWRLKWHQNLAYSLAYHRPSDRIDLYAGHPGRQMYLKATHALSLKKHGLGYPNESDLHFDPDGTLYALVRRDADSFSAQFGTSRPPYRRWQWQDLGKYVGGPAWLPLNDHYFLVAGRAWTGKALFTRLWLLNRQQGKLTELMTLPSAGDTSYPGLELDGDTLYMSYYSGHMDNQSRVYLARLSGIASLKQELEEV